MTIDHVFAGSALCAVNRDGCLILPAFVRDVLARRASGSELTFGRHDVDPCLIAYDRGQGRNIYLDLERRRVAGDGLYRGALRRSFGQAEDASLDDSGKVSIPAMLRDMGKIRTSALLVGAGGIFEIWDPQVALKSDDSFLSEMAAWRLDRGSPTFQ